MLDPLPHGPWDETNRHLEQISVGRASEDGIWRYSPYPKQAEFHAAGASHRERLLLAGNQLGKTVDLSLTKGVHGTI
jgi:hypothetical protein